MWKKSSLLILMCALYSSAALALGGTSGTGTGTSLTAGSGGGSGTITLGTSASATNPQRSGQADTGLYSDTSGHVSVSVDVTGTGTQAADFTSTFLNVPSTSQYQIGGINVLSLNGTTTIILGGGSNANSSTAVGIGSSCAGGNDCTAIGRSATTGSGAVAVGSGAGNSAGGGITEIGYQARGSGSNTISIGNTTGSNNVSGANNVMIGAGVGSTTLTTGASNILIGTSSAVTTVAAATSNNLNIGNLLQGDMTNSSALGKQALFLQSTASSVDYITITAGIAGSPGSSTISGTGTDTNISIKLVPKGTGFINLTGTTTGTNADFLCLDASGNIVLQNSACTISMRKFKDDIKPLSNIALIEIMQLNPVSFKMKPMDIPNPDKNFLNPQYGFIAEDVANVDHNLSIYNDDGSPKSYRQEAIIALLTKGIQQQQREIHNLETEVINMKINNDACASFGWSGRLIMGCKNERTHQN